MFDPDFRFPYTGGMDTFNFARTPHIYFGIGEIDTLANRLISAGRSRVLILTGRSSFRDTDGWATLTGRLRAAGVTLDDHIVTGEPTVETVDAIAAEWREKAPDAVVAVGGGSVIDTGKAVSAMIRSEGSIRDYLEGVGDKNPTGEKIPVYAAPTTAGTGTETTKNAVISKVGEGGFKKSLRHDNYVPDAAVIDPELTRSCPMNVTAASGMDAITQLLESFVSAAAGPMTDALVMTGLMTAGRSFERAVKQGDSDIEARKDMSYAAAMSGLGLANAGLGIVHGFASSIGGMFPIPHGTVCGTLLSAATEVIIDKLFDLEEENNTALIKYAEAGKYLSLRDYGTVEDNCRALVDTLARWTEEFSLDRLGVYGITDTDIPVICDKTGRKNTPVDLETGDLIEILAARL